MLFLIFFVFWFQRFSEESAFFEVILDFLPYLLFIHFHFCGSKQYSSALAQYPRTQRKTAPFV